MGKAFAPAHISGIFAVFLEEDSGLSGSTGCGLCLEKGAITEVRRAKETTIRLNGVGSEAPTTQAVIELLTQEPVLVETGFNIPVGCGFGASGAGALSTALALNDEFSMDLTMNELAGAAHIAEVRNMTGLGDVPGQASGGIVIRKEPGISGSIDRIPCRNECISWVSFGGIETREVLSDEMKKKSVNKAGRYRLKELLKRPCLENFFTQSNAFAKEIELMSPEVMDAIEAVEAAGGHASQAMLGDTVFALDGAGALSEFGEVSESRISNEGAHLL